MSYLHTREAYLSCMEGQMIHEDKFVLEPLNFADDCVRFCYCRNRAIFENWPDTLFIDL